MRTEIPQECFSSVLCRDAGLFDGDSGSGAQVNVYKFHELSQIKYVWASSSWAVNAISFRVVNLVNTTVIVASAATLLFAMNYHWYYYDFQWDKMYKGIDPVEALLVLSSAAWFGACALWTITRRL